MSVIGKDLPHDSARGHVTGESVYIDDMPLQKNELLVDFVGSPVAHGRIRNINLADAAGISGVVGLFTYKDLGGINKFGPILQDEVLLCEDHSTFIGEPIVVIAAETRKAIELARRAIKIDVEELPPVLTIDEAKEKKDFIDKTYSIKRGDIKSAFENAKHVIEGTIVMGGQDHFSLESQAALAYPGEHNQLIVWSSTQAPSEVQQVIARVLGLQQNQVVVITKRLGGGFGGKETQASHPAAMAALVALKTKRPARIIYTKDADMMFTGKRHPFQNDYKVAFDDEGMITALEAHLFADGGAANDLSTAVLGRALTHIDNAYYLPNIEVIGQICRTNFPPTTAFRGFGGPQGIITIENIMEEVAEYLKKDAFEIRRKNCYGVEERNITHYGQLLKHNTLPLLFDTLSVSADYKKRQEEVAQFNRQSKTHLKGLALTAVKFGISFTNLTLNQANALVNVYLDGTVQVSTGAIEMGQGVNTNIRQLVAAEFAIDPNCVLVMATSTEKNNNTSATAASSATDLNGSAAVNACQKIKQSLAECAASFFSSKEIGIGGYPERIIFADGFVYDERRPQNKLAFTELVVLAYRERRSLGERGFYKTKGIGFDWSVGQGSPFLYYTNGCAAAEVLIDRFTGQLRVERVDILMDVGNPINPGINMGQIIGAFVQGMGWATAEELKYSDKGALLSHSPTTYKIPGVHDMPPIFNVNIIENDTNTENVRGSKAVGEPPFVLGISVWAAVKNALSFVSGKEIPQLSLPATHEQILSRLMQYQHAADPTKQSKKSKDKQPATIAP